MRDTMVKINDRYEFPLQLDLDRDNGKYLSPDLTGMCGIFTPFTVFLSIAVVFMVDIIMLSYDLLFLINGSSLMMSV
jgi:hypothetical protein